MVDLSAIQWNEHGLAPAIVQDARSGEVLMLAWMSAESLCATLARGETVFWSRSRAQLWHKGATSGNIQRLRSIHVDCDTDALLIRVEPAGPACHTGARSCFFRALEEIDTRVGVASVPQPATETTRQSSSHWLESIIRERQRNPRPGSYTNTLLEAGAGKIAQKVGEEAVELIVAALAESRGRQIEELADIVYHTLVLMAQLDIPLDELESALRRRHRPDE